MYKAYLTYLYMQGSLNFLGYTISTFLNNVSTSFPLSFYFDFGSPTQFYCTYNNTYIFISQWATRSD